MVRFAPLNLTDDHYAPLSNCTGGVDVIFCRNVLMYFTPMGMRKVIRQLYRYLAADGWLIVSPTETCHELFSEFATVNLGDVTLYRKSTARLPAALALPVGDVARSSIPLPEWTVQATVPLRTSDCRLIQESPDQKSPHNEADAVSAGLPAVSYGEVLGLYEQGCYEAAGQMAAALLSQNGRDAQAMFLLARIYANQGKLAEALAWCDKAIAADKMAARAPLSSGHDSAGTKFHSRGPPRAQARSVCRTSVCAGSFRPRQFDFEARNAQGIAEAL